MPKVEHTCAVVAPLDAVWDFIKDMDNWAPYLTGYQKHETLSETDSVWTLKGEVGAMTRRVQLRVHITEWNEMEKVEFSLTGINESVTGSGTFQAVPGGTPLPAVAPKEPPARRPPGAMGKLVSRLAGRGDARGEETEVHSPGGPATELTFHLELKAGGPSGPLVNALLGPLLKPAARDLAGKIAARVEELRSRK